MDINLIQTGLAELVSPIQIGFVLLLALIVFGPKQLPEIGKQIGSAIRDLKKASGEMMKSLNPEYEPDYNSNNHYNSYNDNHSTYAAYSPPAISASVDMTDYTISGIAPKDTTPAAAKPEIAYTDYTMAYTPPAPAGTVSSSGAQATEPQPAA
jgi:sec-independent protein translocase protein TatA